MKAEKSAGDKYQTPDWLLQYFGDWFDPCPIDWDGSTDGLSVEWPDKTYINPPYSNPYEWVKKGIAEAKKGKRIAMLLRVDTSTKWYALLIENGAHIFWCNQRLRFLEGKPANFASMLVFL